MKNYNLNLIKFCTFAGDFEMPVLEACYKMPEKLQPFHKAVCARKGAKEAGTFVHFFLDDYQFERLWNTPERYLTCLSRYEGILSPDFSLYVDMPVAMQIWNTYRNRLLAAWLQYKEREVIPTVSWSDCRSYRFCFEGLPIGGVFALSTIGTQKSRMAKKLFNQGYEEFLKRCHPDALVVYGQRTEVIEATPGVQVCYFDNDNIKRMRSYGR